VEKLPKMTGGRQGINGENACTLYVVADANAAIEAEAYPALLASPGYPGGVADNGASIPPK